MRRRMNLEIVASSRDKNHVASHRRKEVPFLDLELLKENFKKF